MKTDRLTNQLIDKATYTDESSQQIIHTIRNHTNIMGFFFQIALHVLLALLIVIPCSLIVYPYLTCYQGWIQGGYGGCITPLDPIFVHSLSINESQLLQFIGLYIEKF